MKQAVIENGRARFALEAVNHFVNVTAKDNDKTKKEYKSYARKFPALVMSNGLAATLAFAFEKGGAWSSLYDNLSDWLTGNGYFPKPEKHEDLMKFVCSCDSDKYRLVTGEVLALFKWLRRFASGLIEGEADV